MYAHNKIHILSLYLESSTEEEAISELHSIVASSNRAGWMLTSEQLDTLIGNGEVYFSNSPTH